MFTGLVERVGRIAAIENIDSADGLAQKLVIEVPDAAFLTDAVIGESISVNGCCLTVEDLTPTSFAVTAIEETLRRTTLGQRQAGDKVNLERALLVSARLGGHIVQGHVDGVATVTGSRPEGEGWWVTFEPPHDLLKYVVEKGSVCLDGVSLTVANVSYSKFSVALIPHTREVTIAGNWEPGVQVNVEVDIVAKYVERLTTWTAQNAEMPRALEI